MNTIKWRYRRPYLTFIFWWENIPAHNSFLEPMPRYLAIEILMYRTLSTAPHPPINHYQVQYKRCAAKSFKCITNSLHWLPCQSLWLWLKCFGWQMFYQKDKLSAHILWDIFVTFSPRDLAQKNCHGDKLSGRQIVRIHFQFIQQSIFRSARTS